MHVLLRMKESISFKTYWILRCVGICQLWISRHKILVFNKLCLTSGQKLWSMFLNTYLLLTDVNRILLLFSLTCTYILICLRYFFHFLVWCLTDLYTQNTLHRQIHVRWSSSKTLSKAMHQYATSNLLFILLITRQLTLKFWLTIEMSYLYNHCKH